MTDDSAFKKQVRTRMTETGENYTTARRAVIAAAEAAQDTAIRSTVQRAIERAVGVSAVDVSRAAGRLRVDIRAAQPILLAGHRGAAADQLRGELEELTGSPVQLNIREVPGPARDST